MSDFTYFRIGVPNDMVADIMWHDDFEVCIESYSKHETNYQRYFGTPEKAAVYLSEHAPCEDCKLYGGCFADVEDCEFSLREWLESEEE